MSRGLGSLQRCVVSVLESTDGRELPLRELRRRAGDPDRSNLRRAIRSLIKRNLAQEVQDERGRRVRLAAPAAPRRRAGGEPALPRSHTYAQAETRRRRRQSLAKENYRGSRWKALDETSVRPRPPGPMQQEILELLVRHPGPLSEGLDVGIVKMLLGADPSNARRAIRALLKYGLIEETVDGRRIRAFVPKRLRHVPDGFREDSRETLLRILLARAHRR